ncbi:hypothetical protein AZI86_03395 [Bdellovibrio bacteriovorus]|uniref:Uncharacterized protein n=1 Tax=Bdellovibrio bacteriovorus TaxID=959 RepID=A0A150WNR5_BDEBC|nr:hypothetical protein [Bdellovibrio bacteriovorus]KYG66122.1 hypothetical protein AZI86_03395 [Bdellovibrio bacteriovorus]
MIRNQKGFALVMTMALLPALIAGFFLAWAAVGFIQQDLALKHACRDQGITGQKNAGVLLERLLKLNPEAENLKRKQARLKVQIAAALAKGNFPLAASLRSQLFLVDASRLQLDIKQRGLIHESNRALFTAHNRGRAQIQKNLQATSSVFLQLKLKNIRGSAPQLAVRPDYPDIAPTYSTVSNFSTQQALAHEWHYSAAVGTPFSYFLPGEFEFKKACAVSLKKELVKWSPQIIRGNFSWKSVW